MRAPGRLPWSSVPRRNRSPKSAVRGRATAARPLSAGVGSAQRVSGPDGDWMVRTVPGSQAVKTYRCPGCDHEIRAGIPHVVAWPADEYGSAEERRHWHNGCWQARGRRGPTRRWW
ncbi:hypothetical protein G443_004316 [Actinoalloteichus cyanogriseus DSM 43889]|uniref:ATP/GTP-binding protein n=1 Tax=Actinoalloteichus caeruleus DSM 43889 TaxID=1120930 RepID=A0ABT1JQS9_ACTCY|nr:hypothetical protein [Actinoalloteichus caeruleus DSM 43889]